MRRPLVLTLAVLALWLRFALGSTAAECTFSLVDQKSQPVADAVVSLVPLDRAPPPVTPVPAPEIGQRGQEFSPFVTAVRTGTAIHFPNRDMVEHYVYSESEAKRFQLPLYAPGKDETIVFDRPGVVALGCNIHDWMLAYVVVVDTPWFAVTSAAGSAMLRGLPPGHYRAEIWHPRLRSVVTREVRVPTDAAESFTLALKPDHRIRRPVETTHGGYH